MTPYLPLNIELAAQFHIFKDRCETEKDLQDVVRTTGTYDVEFDAPNMQKYVVLVRMKRDSIKTNEVTSNFNTLAIKITPPDQSMYNAIVDVFNEIQKFNHYKFHIIEFKTKHN